MQTQAQYIATMTAEPHTLTAYIQALIDPANDLPLDVDHLYELAHSDHAEGSVDLIVVVAHAMSEMTVTLEQAKRCSALIQQIAVNTLVFNVGEGGVWAAEAVDAIIG